MYSLTNVHNSIHTFVSVQSFSVNEHIHFTSNLSTQISVPQHCLYVLNGNVTFQNSIHHQLIPNYIYFHTIQSNYTLQTNLPASTYANIFDKNPVLLSNQTYCIEFCTTMISMGNGNNVHSYLRTSGTCGIENMTVTLKTAVGSQSDGSMIKSNAITVTQLSANAQTLIHEGANAQPNRNIEGNVMLRTNSTGGSFIFQIMEDDGPATPQLLANSWMRIIWLGPSSNDIMFGNYV